MLLHKIKESVIRNTNEQISDFNFKSFHLAHSCPLCHSSVYKPFNIGDKITPTETIFFADYECPLCNFKWRIISEKRIIPVKVEEIKNGQES